MNDRLFSKFTVPRKDGRDQPGGDKADARYFVLDYVHDPFARVALEAYAEACRGQLPGLAADLVHALGLTGEGGDDAVVRDRIRTERA
jgi:hypothetical protein